METVAKYRITPGGTVISKGFEGDLLVGMAPTMSNETRTFLSHYADHHNVAVYAKSLSLAVALDEESSAKLWTFSKPSTATVVPIG